MDGSYTCRKRQRLEQTGLTVSPLEVPPIPPMGWEDVTEHNFSSLCRLPKISSGIVKGVKVC